MDVLETSPPELTRTERRIVWFTTVVVAVTRLWARSKTLWDWDEALFCYGVRSFDVTQHHPHPPGFPVFIAAAKVVRLFAGSDFHALQFVVIATAVSLFPLCFFLARELRFPFRTAFVGSLLFVFLPNVWLYGGTAFSDVPALALVLIACLMLLRGGRSNAAFLAGAVLLGLAAGVRPQSLVFGCAPGLAALWSVRRRSWWVVVLALVLGAATVAACYGGAALASASVEGYFSTTRAHSEWVRTVDGYLNPNRPPLPSLIPAFFGSAIPGGRSARHVLLALAAIGALASLIRRHRSVWMLIGIFLPFNLFAWIMLDVNGMTRFAVSYAAMYALLAAEGAAVLAWLSGRFAPAVQVMVIAALAGRAAWWSVPAIQEVRRNPSPPVMAMRWIRASVPRSETVYVHGSMGPWTDYFLGDYRTLAIENEKELPLREIGRNDWLVAEGTSAVAEAKNFIRKRGRLFTIVRQRYFEVSVAPVSDMLRFGDGWYDEESAGQSAWRWMGGRSVTLLPPVTARGRLTLAFVVPSELVPRRATVTISFNGEVIDRFVCTGADVRKTWIVPSVEGRWNELVISIDQIVNPEKEGLAPDPRDLGLQLTSYSWSPV